MWWTMDTLKQVDTLDRAGNLNRALNIIHASSLVCALNLAVRGYSITVAANLTKEWIYVPWFQVKLKFMLIRNNQMNNLLQFNTS